NGNGDPAGFECHSAPPVLGCEDKGEVRGGLRMNGCLNVPGAPAGTEANDPVEPAFTTVCRVPPLESLIALAQSDDRYRRFLRDVSVYLRGGHRPEHLVG